MQFKRGTVLEEVEHGTGEFTGDQVRAVDMLSGSAKFEGHESLYRPGFSRVTKPRCWALCTRLRADAADRLVIDPTSAKVNTGRRSSFSSVKSRAARGPSVFVCK